jgi:uncharacterized RDD family membrane protein YckC
MTVRCIRCGAMVQGMAQMCDTCRAEEQARLGPLARFPAEAAPATATNCPSCGSLLGEGPFCPSCGSRVGEFVYAGFWMRLAAWLIDGVILTLVQLPIALVVADAVTAASLQLAIGIAYVIGFWVARGATPGKMLMGVEIMTTDGQPIGLGRAIARYLGYFLSGFLLLIGYIMIGLRRDKRGLHDLIAGTVVVRVKYL